MGLRSRAIGTKWEFEGIAERSNAGISSLRMGLHGIARGDGAVTRGRRMGRRVIGRGRDGGRGGRRRLLL